jgi:hypothetical protein
MGSEVELRDRAFPGLKIETWGTRWNWLDKTPGKK